MLKPHQQNDEKDVYILIWEKNNTKSDTVWQQIIRAEFLLRMWRFVKHLFILQYFYSF